MNYVKLTDEESPLLIPYPSWEANTIDADPIEGSLADNATIISTIRISVDECDRLWVMDMGISDIDGSSKKIADPALVIFDLNPDKLIKRYTLPPSVIQGHPLFPNVVSYLLVNISIR